MMVVYNVILTSYEGTTNDLIIKCETRTTIQEAQKTKRKMIEDFLANCEEGEYNQPTEDELKSNITYLPHSDGYSFLSATIKVTEVKENELTPFNPMNL